VSFSEGASRPSYILRLRGENRHVSLHLDGCHTDRQKIYQAERPK
jgi:hypothetical protein